MKAKRDSLLEDYCGRAMQGLISNPEYHASNEVLVKAAYWLAFEMVAYLKREQADSFVGLGPGLDAQTIKSLAKSKKWTLK